MKKVILWDKSIIYVTDEQALRVIQAKQLKRDIKLNMPSGSYEYLAHNSVARITNAGNEVAEQVPEDHRIESTAEMSDEERAKISEKIKKMKEDFIKQSEERRRKNESN